MENVCPSLRPSLSPSLNPVTQSGHSVRRLVRHFGGDAWPEADGDGAPDGEMRRGLLHTGTPLGTI